MYDCMDGLDQGICTLLLDRRGRFWAATAGGLCRFDGHRFHVCTNGLPGFPATVRALHEAPDGSLWLATTGQGVLRYDGMRFEIFGEEQGLPDSILWDICQDPEGRLWFASRKGPCRFESGQFILDSALKELYGTPVHSLLFDRQGRLWIGSTQGIALYHQGVLSWFVRHEPAGLRVWDLYEDSHGRIWVAVQNQGLWWIEDDVKHTAEEYGLPLGDDVVQVYEDDAGRLWFATLNSGLLCWNGRAWNGYTTSMGLHENRVSCMLVDSEEQLWIGHHLAGVTRYDLGSIETLCHETVTEVMARDSEGRLWFSNGRALCCQVNGESFVTEQFPGRVMALTFDHQGRLWAGGMNCGLRRYDTATDALEGRGFRYTLAQGLLSNSVTSIHEGSSGSLWVGTKDPGSIGRVTGDAIESEPIDAANVFRILEDRVGRLWYGGYEGGGLYLSASGITTRYTTAEGLPNNRIKSLLEDSTGDIWIGTENGLCRFDGKDLLAHGSNIESGSHFYQISACDAAGVLWFGTLRGGLYRTDGQYMQQLTTEDGLPSNSVTALEPLADGSMLIGTYGGTVRYRPIAVHPPEIEIIEIIAQDQFSVQEFLKLTTVQAQLVTIRFRAYSLSTRRMRYVYRLEGRDTDWQETWDPEARYEELGEGTYVFRVFALNRDLVPSTEPASIHLEVMPDPMSEQLEVYKARMNHMERLLAYHERTRQHNQALLSLATTPFHAEDRVEDALAKVTEAACSHIEADQCSVWMMDESGRLLKLIDAYNRDQDLHTTGETMALHNSGYAEIIPILEHRRALAIDNTANHPATRSPASIDALDVRAVLVSAIRIGGRVAGVLSLGIQGKTGRWSTEDEQFVSSLADLVAMILETSERMRVQEALRHSEEQLRQSLKMEAVGRLAGGIAHDFNNLLTAIIGCADLVIGNTSTEDPMRGPLQEILLAGERAASLTRQLLTFSRKAPVCSQIVDVAQLVTNMAKLLGRLISENIHLVVITAPGTGCIEADPSQLEMVLVNLAVNARDAMPQGGELIIRTGSRTLSKQESAQWPPCRPGRHVSIEVSDTGCGMEDAVCQRAFEPFFTTKQQGEGTGLGLSTVYGIVQQYKGSIALKTARGKGTTFTILLPYSDRGVVAATPVAASSASGNTGSETILVVEDEEVVRTLVARILESLGYNIIVASNPKEAIRLSRGHQGVIHLLLSDVVMPAMSGPEMAQILSPERPDMRIIFMSGYTDNISVRDWIKHNSGQFVQKPFTRDVLAATIRATLEAPC